jgi:hypothetical protein
MKEAHTHPEEETLEGMSDRLKQIEAKATELADRLEAGNDAAAKRNKRSDNTMKVIFVALVVLVVLSNGRLLRQHLNAHEAVRVEAYEGD